MEVALVKGQEVQFTFEVKPEKGQVIGKLFTHSTMIGNDLVFGVDFKVLVEDKVSLSVDNAGTFNEEVVKVEGILHTQVKIDGDLILQENMITSDHPKFDYGFVNAEVISFELENKDQYNEKLIKENIKDFLEFDYMRKVKFAFIKEN